MNTELDKQDKQKEIRYVLFDLDGTLLQWDAEAFLEDYLKSIAGFVGESGGDPKYFIKCLWAATQEMIRNQEAGESNRDVFEKHFFPMLGKEKNEIEPLIFQFYESKFKDLVRHSHPSEISRKNSRSSLE